MRAMERIGILVGVFAFTMATIYGFWTASTTLGIEWVGVEETNPDELPSPDMLDIRPA